MLRINLSRQALKFLKSIPIKHAKQIERKLTELSVAPMSSDIKSLKGYTHLLRADSGEYRIIYQIEASKNALSILAIGKRNDGEVYKRFKRVFQ